MPPRRLLIDEEQAALAPIPLIFDDPALISQPHLVEAMEKIRLAQLQDANLVPLIRYLCDGSIPYRVKPARWRAKTDEFCLQAGILYRKVKHRDQFYLAIAVPLQLQRYILGLFHNNALSAHFSSNKMIARLTSCFWWSGMATDCEKWSSSCIDCTSRKSVADQAGGMLGLLPQALHPGDLVAIDFLGPFKKMLRGFTYICILFDHHTRYPALVATKSTEYEEAVHSLYQGRIVHYGIPRVIIHDQGSAFTSKMFQKLMAILGIHNLQTAAYQPASVERSNRVINSALTHVVNSLQTNWDLRLTDLEFAMRTSPHSVTGVSPMEMMTGFAPRLPTDIFQCAPGTLLDLAERKLVELPFDCAKYMTWP
jgi:hypothetical protein